MKNEELLMKRKTVILISVIVLAVMLSACGNNEDDINITESPDSDEGINVVQDGDIDNSVIENYIYIPKQVRLGGLSYHVSGMKTHGEQIVFWYVDSASDIVIVSVLPDGSNREETKVAVLSERTQVGELNITNDGNFELIIYVINEYENTIAISYRLKSPQGVELRAIDLSETLPTIDPELFRIWQAVFDDEGNFVIRAQIADENALFLFDGEGNLLGTLIVHYGDELVRLSDGSVAALSRVVRNNYLRVLDFDTGDWGITIPLPISDVRHLFYAGATEFDLLIFDGRNIIGYVIETATQTPLFNWIEACLDLVPNFNLSILPDGSVVVLYSQTSGDLNNRDWNTRLFALTRFERTEDGAQTVITLGGLFVSNDIRQAVAGFNREYAGYQIEIIDYADFGNFRASISQFHIDVITGNAPDIIINILDTELEDTAFLSDLYPFIDADPQLNRSDFFPNVLRAMESADGRLKFITDGFGIFTLLAIPETAAQVNPLTFNNVLNWLNEADERTFAGILETRERFVRNIIFTVDDFIDWGNNNANLNSDEFIEVLEIAYNLPRDDFVPDVAAFDGIDKLLRNGTQLFVPGIIAFPNSLRVDRLWIYDIVAVGYPTATGGQHFVNVRDFMNLGISSASPHQEAAWSFLRRFLLPDAEISDWVFPLRKDRYEERVTIAMTPFLDSDGNEIPSRISAFDDRELYAMTVEEAAEIREIIDSAYMRFRSSEIIENILSEVLHGFFSGRTSAAEAARVLQARIQIYLYERS